MLSVISQFSPIPISLVKNKIFLFLGIVPKWGPEKLLENF